MILSRPLLSEARVRAVCLALVAAYLATALIMVITASGWIDLAGRPIGGDFLEFYGASRLALHGEAAAAYEPARLLQAQAHVIPGLAYQAPWHYPPPALLLVAPLALAPYGLSLALWSALGLTAFVAMTRRFDPSATAMLAALAFPAVLVNLLGGQNGLFGAAVLGAGLLLLERRPWLAGAVLGLLACKPHLALLLPVLLLAGGRWKALAGGALGVVLLAIASAGVFGLDPWRAFFANSAELGRILQGGGMPLNKLVSWYGAGLILGLPQPVAWAVHALAALGLGAAAAWAWRRPGPYAIKAALGVVACLSVPPYLFDYDLALLAVPAAFAWRARAEGVPGAAPVLLIAFVTPIAFTGLAHFGIPLAPAALVALFVALWRMRAAAASTAAASAAQQPAAGAPTAI